VGVKPPEERAPGKLAVNYGHQPSRLLSTAFCQPEKWIENGDFPQETRETEPKIEQKRSKPRQAHGAISRIAPQKPQ